MRCRHRQCRNLHSRRLCANRNKCARARRPILCRCCACRFLRWRRQAQKPPLWCSGEATCWSVFCPTDISPSACPQRQAFCRTPLIFLHVYASFVIYEVGSLCIAAAICRSPFGCALLAAAMHSGPTKPDLCNICAKIMVFGEKLVILHRF